MGGSSLGGLSSTGGTSGYGGSNAGAVAGSGASPGPGGIAGNIASSTNTTSVPTYTVSGQLSDLIDTTNGVELQLNGGSSQVVKANGTFTFATGLATGAAYKISVSKRPSSPRQFCRVVNDSGTIAQAGVTDVGVTCSRLARYNLVVDGTDKSVSTFVIDGPSGRSTYIGKITTANPPSSVAVHHAKQFAYVSYTTGGAITRFAVGDNGLLTGPTSLSALASTGPQFITVDSARSVAYVVDQNAKSIAQFAIGADGGLTTTGSPVSTGEGPTAVTLDPLGKYAYVVNKTSANVSQYSVDSSTGVLKPLPVLTLDGASKPTALALEPSGAYAYVANNGADPKISQFTVNRGTNALDPTGTTPIATQGDPKSIVVDPAGDFLYVANSTGNSVTQYVINQSNGVLSAHAPPRIAAQRAPDGLAQVTGDKYVEPYGKFVYVTSDDDALWIFGTNEWTQASNANSVAIPGNGPVTIAVDPTGAHAYVVNTTRKSISQYAINAVTGSLASFGAINPPTGALPSAIALHPSNRFAYVTNKLDKNISQYLIGEDGSLGTMTPATVSVPGDGFPVTAVVDPSGRFLYAAYNDGKVVRFIIGTDGALASTGTASVAAGGQPAALHICPSGTNLYAANSLSDSVSQYGIQSNLGGDGTLLSLNPATVQAGTVPYFVATDPSGGFVYVANSNGGSISQYEVSSSGALKTPPSVVSVGANASGCPYSIAIDPSGRYAYVVDSRETDGSVWRYPISETGARTLGTPVSAGQSITNGRSIAMAVGYK